MSHYLMNVYKDFSISHSVKTKGTVPQLEQECSPLKHPWFTKWVAWVYWFSTQLNQVFAIISIFHCPLLIKHWLVWSHLSKHQPNASNNGQTVLHHTHKISENKTHTKVTGVGESKKTSSSAPNLQVLMNNKIINTNRHTKNWTPQLVCWCPHKFGCHSINWIAQKTAWWENLNESINTSTSNSFS